MPDFFDLGRHFSTEERAIQRTVRDFVDAHVLPTIADHWERGACLAAPRKRRGPSPAPVSRGSPDAA